MLFIIVSIFLLAFLAGYITRDYIGNKPIPEEFFYNGFLILFFFGIILAAFGLNP